jgi:hypothetical protein
MGKHFNAMGIQIFFKRAAASAAEELIFYRYIETKEAKGE